MNRIYQGRVTFAEINGGKDEKGHPRWIPLDQWSTVIWRHHELFQDAVNYYLFCLAALSNAETSAMGKMRRQLSDVWAPYTLRGKPVRGLRAALAPYLGIGSSAGIEKGFAAVLAGNNSSAELLQLAVDSMVLALGGDAKIQQGCRTYWPMFCNPEFKGTFPNSNARLERDAAREWLPAWLHDPETAKDLPGAAARLKLGLFANAAAGKADLVGDEAREKLHKAITQLGTERPAAKAQLDGLKRLVDALPETVSITPYVGSSAKGAAKDRLNAFLLFKFVAATDFTFGLLRDAYPAPEQAKWPAATAEPAAEDPLLKFGDDPIRLARGARGFVLRAFTSHACWGGTGPTSAVWSEFDIAAFKEALKTANQFRLKTEERLEKAGELQAELDWMDGKVQKRRAVEQSEGDEEGGHAILGGDPRLKIVKHLFEVELAEEHYLAEGESVAYGLHPRTLRCYRELVGVWNKKVDPGEPFSEKVYKKLIEATNEFQTANRDLMGSATLFRKLLERDYWCLWIAPDQASAAQRQKAGFSERIIEDYQHYLELQSDIVRLKEPIRFTPADAELSRRLYMFSDLDGRAEPEHLPNGTPHGFGVDVSLAVDLGGIWKETRVRLSYSAPRLCRDGLRKTSGEDLEKVPWLQPMMAAMNLPEPSLQDFSKCAVSLMPNRQGDGFRHLLNFPVQLDADVVKKAVGAESRWEKQFVAYGKSAGEKKWFLSWPREAKPKQKEVGPWWERLNAFSCMAVDLGQRDAGAYAVMDVRVDMDWGKKPARNLGATEGRSWSTTLAASGVLRLPGEDAKVLRDGKWQEELYGEKGRSASGAEWQEASDLVRGLARYIADGGAETAGEEAVINSWLGEDSRALSFPKLNDKLLVVARRAQGWLARCHRWLWMLGDEKKKDRALEEVREQERRPDWASHAKAGEVDPLTQLIKGEIGLLNTFLPDQLVRLANRCAPLRGRRWAWNKHPIPDFARKGCHLLEIVEAADHMPPVAGQRGGDPRHAPELSPAL